jgi:predicted phage-related endonuclease
MPNLPIADGTEITPSLRDAWLALRQPDARGFAPVLGASQLAQAVGLSPYGGPLELFGRMRGLVPPFAGTSASRKGLALQGWIEDEYTRQTGETLARREVFHIGPVFHGITLIATLDGVTTSEKAYEAKWTAYRSSDRYGEPGTDQVPLYVLAQMTGQFLCSGLTEGHLVAAIGDDDPVVYPLGLDQKFLETLLDKVERFCWHVAQDVAPDFGHEDDWPTLLARNTWTGAATLLGDERLEALVAQWEALKPAVAAGEKAKEERKALAGLIGEAMAGHAAAQLPDGRVVAAKKIAVAAREQRVEAFAYLKLDVREWT